MIIRNSSIGYTIQSCITVNSKDTQMGLQYAFYGMSRCFGSRKIVQTHFQYIKR